MRDDRGRLGESDQIGEGRTPGPGEILVKGRGQRGVRCRRMRGSSRCDLNGPITRRGGFSQDDEQLVAELLPAYSNRNTCCSQVMNARTAWLMDRAFLCFDSPFASMPARRRYSPAMGMIGP